ncbi:ABC transporter substrate-binding protein [Streptomyces rimosus]|uniref:D-ribose-binding periplasmic protein n=1 Tax=Streptomyces rimosus subsp. rimosus TaxID=132474 RepID=A0ABY3Z6S8_STRRM|nr:MULTISPECIES: D-ribose ABC transporter substrate-binding protein [Streptomyces]KEF05835.1 ABC transporter substrate-binding protein [Streptomyces rimosus]KEF20537.1 ABC transporter substrate-binding protein [Streptomyces rimosus]KUJ39805.1 D-ribose ABC transporter substrate-binding protein [Streptomyces rimosus subsp. rimosus]UNZ06020.1 D-ribose-binding periplasmic protein precursor [Streptomyces rimosus subsp. rimosus]UTH97476.1 D-ribose-binding periplasmic protein precursor [Streptomyces 
MRGRAWRSGPGTGSGPVGRRTSTGRLGWPAGRRTGLLGAAVLAGALVLSGCDRGGNTDLGLALSTLNNPFFVGIKEGAQAEAERRGLHINITDAQNDPMQQINQMETFTSQDVKAAIINPVDSDAAVPAVGVANRAKVPVISIDRGVNGGDVGSTIASDNVAGGRLAAKTLAESLGGKGKVAFLEGQPGTSAARERGQGFEEGIKRYPGIEVVARQPADFDRTKGMDVMSNMLQAHRDIGGVFAANDEMALGAAKSLGARAGRDVKIVAFDGTPDGVAAVRGGTLTATVAQQPRLLGKQAVDQALRAARGERPPKQVKVPVVLVTSRNAAEFDG